jgi:hypothetical protein
LILAGLVEGMPPGEFLNPSNVNRSGTAGHLL